MNPSDENPKLPTWLFIVTDVALLGAAALVAQRSAYPMTATSIIAIVTCVGLGALVGLVPIVARFERQKNEALDDRQRALEALARTVSSSAEQISIAAGGLHEIAEIAQKNLRHAEQLPHKLQDKIAEFQAQLATATDAEKEELERELLSLRTTESERLESVSQRIAKSAAEWAKLETATHQHLAATNEALGKLSLGTASAIGKAQVAAEQALSQARVEAARTLGEASGQATRAIESAKGAALAELDTKFTRLTGSLEEKISRLEAIALRFGPDAPDSRRPAETGRAAASVNETAAPPAGAAAAVSQSDDVAGKSDLALPLPKRPRKLRKEEAATEAGAPAAVSASVDLSVPKSDDIQNVIATPEAGVVEPPPIPIAKIAEVAPVVPHTSDPFANKLTNGSTSVQTVTEAAPAIESTKSPRKRSVAKKSEADIEPALGLDLAPSAPVSGLSERGISSDGATRLLVTAYIGIGNRLFIRGEGPGLSWEKGVPLQFVSIGKWRWETNDANSPVQFKLYKNDDVECSALGRQSLDPGNQQELTAAF